MIDIDKLKFNSRGLIPAVIVDAVSKKVLSMSYMTRESLKISMQKGLVCLWSRSRQRIWIKGEHSKNYQHIVEIIADCDYESLTVIVKKDGPACYKGTDSCFTERIWRSDELNYFSFDALSENIKKRREKMPEGSYTTYLLRKGSDKTLKKLNELCFELALDVKNEGKDEISHDISEIAYHIAVLMNQTGVKNEDVYRYLSSMNIMEPRTGQGKPKETVNGIKIEL